MYLEYVNCNYCGSQDFTFYASTHSSFEPYPLLQVVRCQQCDLIFVNPRVVGRENEIAGAKIHKGRVSQAKSPKTRIKNKLLLQKLSRYKDGGNFLDFGCGMGSLVHEAQNAGWNAYGYELHVNQAEAANAYWNTDRILSYDFDKFRHEYSNYFDVINASQVFEHLIDPLGKAKELRDLLKDGGVFALDVPNVNKIRNIFCKKSDTIQPGYHLYYFSANTIAKMLVMAGFRVVEAKTTFVGVGLLGKYIPNLDMASRIAYKLYQLPTAGFGLYVVAIKSAS
jgi:2-polyprenyl-3-methyl-5-hydroxy-6-metoxy-1,4-benzoquinol methylase